MNLFIEMKKKIKSSQKKGQCCRYSWEIVDGNTITDFFLYNQDVFDNSWNVFAFYDDDTLIPKRIGNDISWFMNGMLIFSCMVHNFQQWSQLVKWDEVGAWYFYTYPTDIPKGEFTPLYLHKNKIPLLHGESFNDYFKMPPEWEFIHTLKPDLAVIKQPDDKLLVLGLNKTNVDASVGNLPWNMKGNEDFPF